MNVRKMFTVLAAITVLGALTSSALGAPVFFGPSPYLSTGDIPNGFYLGGVPDGLEDFEDMSLDFGITASHGLAIGPVGLTDSVDGDDGNIDGSGTNGHSWFYSGGSIGVTFTFAGPLPTAAGIVWTDGSWAGTTTFEAFGPGMASLCTLGPVSLGDDSNMGTTAEDCFFGILDSEGILAH